MSKFHAGQRCMIVQSEADNLGRVVTLVKYVGEIDEFKYTDWWEIKESLNLMFGGTTQHAYEDQLMPLDEAQTNNACTQTQGSLRHFKHYSSPAH